MYSNSFAVAIKHNGKILRENKDIVSLPYGSEFTILIKNLNSRRAKFTLHIDGTNVLDGQDIIINANSDVELKRFIVGGNMDTGNAFKFIERTANIEDGPRGIKIDDGVVRVEFWFEKEVPITRQANTIHTDYYDRGMWRTYGGHPWYGTIGHTGGMFSSNSADVKLTPAAGLQGNDFLRSMGASLSDSTGIAQNASASVNSVIGNVTKENEVGITVPGSAIEQKFTPVYGFNSETQSNIIIVRLAGKIGEIEVTVPVTVKTKQKCVTCSHVNKHNAKYCSECGTSLEII